MIVSIAVSGMGKNMRPRIPVRATLTTIAFGALLTACGVAHATPTPVATTTPTEATDTPAPTHTTAELVTRTAAARLMLPVGGDLADFFIAVISGREMEARTFLAPGTYTTVPNLRDAFGLPQSNGPYTIDTLPLSASGDRGTARTVIAYQGRTYREEVTLVKANGRWKVAAVTPDTAP